jgi:hypothetical protein
MYENGLKNRLFRDRGCSKTNADPGLLKVEFPKATLGSPFRE